MEVLKSSATVRSKLLARLNNDKRNHTEKVQEFFSENQQLPVDFNNTVFWIKARLGRNL